MQGTSYNAMHKSKVTIVGAGIPGLTMALILAQGGVAVTVIDKADLPDITEIEPSGRTAALMQSSLKTLERAGVWPAFRPKAERLAQLSIIDDSEFPRNQDSMVRQDFKAEELGLDEFGYNVPLGALKAALAELVQNNPDITFEVEAALTPAYDAIEQADLIIGADGRNSIVRQWADINVTSSDYGQMAITCLINHSFDHDHTSIEFHRNGGPCTFVPCGEKQSAVVWVEKIDDAQGFLKLPKDSFVHALQERSRGLLGQIELVAGPESWPLMTLKADKMVARQTALIAEAAHVLSPIGAQGLNLSLRDVDVLADNIISAVETGQDIASPTLLKAYERQRMRDIHSRSLGVDILNRMVANDNPAIRGLRRLGLRALGLGGPIRHILMQQGLAPRS